MPDVPTSTVVPGEDDGLRTRPWLLRAGGALLLAVSVAGIALILLAWLWRLAMPEVSGRLLAIPALWSLMLTSFWWQAGLAAMLAALLAGLLRARVATLLWASAAALCLGPTVASWLPSTATDQARAGTGSSLTVYAANLLYGRADMEALTEDIGRADPDVLLFQEVTPRAAEELERLFAESHPHAVMAPRDGAFGQAVFSRISFVEPPRLEIPRSLLPDQDFPTVGVTIGLDGRGVEIWNIHTVPPLGLGSVEHQDAMCRALADMLEANRAGPDRPIVIAGDLNSPEAGVPARRVIRAGATPARPAPGAWVAPTWPAPTDSGGVIFRAARWLGGTRLDHVLATEHFEGVGPDKVGAPIGSDHRPIVRSLRLRTDP